MHQLFLAFQTESMEQEFQLFERLLESNPFRLLIVLVGLAILVLIFMALLFARTNNKLVAGSQKMMLDSHTAQSTQENKVLDMLNTSLNRYADAFEKLGDRQEESMNKLVNTLTTQYEQMGEDQVYINESLTRIVDVVAQSSVNTAKNTEAVATIVVEAAAMHERTRLFLKDQMALALRQYEQHQEQDTALTMMNADFQFPEDNDCRWIVARVKSKTDKMKANVWKIPKFRYDKSVVGVIENGTGELVYIIPHTAWRGWHAVRKIGQPDVCGWVDADLVEIIVPATATTPTLPPKN